jgi:hypothetical protein
VVPIKRGIGFYETMLGEVSNPSRIGAALQGKSIRVISEADFAPSRGRSCGKPWTRKTRCVSNLTRNTLSLIRQRATRGTGTTD